MYPLLFFHFYSYIGPEYKHKSQIFFTAKISNTLSNNSGKDANVMEAGYFISLTKKLIVQNDTNALTQLLCLNSGSASFGGRI